MKVYEAFLLLSLVAVAYWHIYFITFVYYFFFFFDDFALSLYAKHKLIQYSKSFFDLNPVGST